MLAAMGPARADTPEEFRRSFLDGKLTWQQVLDQARKEGKVTFFYWGGNDVLNVWIDSHPGQAMAKLGIRMVANRLTETRGAVDLVIEENIDGKSAGQGAADPDLAERRQLPGARRAGSAVRRLCRTAA